MENCPFCTIVAREIPAEIVYENVGALAMLDIHPHAAGHTVVVPKAHAETILELNENDGALLFEAVREATERLRRALNPAGFTIGINHGKMAGQAIPHLHAHIIPRYEGDGGGSIHSVVKNPPKESVKEIKEKIEKYGN